MCKLRPRDKRACEEADMEIEYFCGNAERMRYADFRSQGFFLGSGVVEEG
jgi:hypothetical protein